MGIIKKELIIDNTKRLLFGIAIVSLLLILCMAVDYADGTICNLNKSTLKENAPEGAILVNNSTPVAVNKTATIIVGKNNDVIHTIKPKYPIISMWAKPSVRSGYAYKWYYRSWINYCPNCHHYNTLLKNPKGVPEREYTCKRCDSDFCAVTGKEKYSWSHKYLRRA